jgi:hypothetical protein
MNIVLIVRGCHGLANASSSEAAELLRILKEKGCGFLPIAGSSRRELHPEKRISSGAISPQIGIEHALLQKTFFDDQPTKPRHLGSADLRFMPGSRGFAQFTQPMESSDPTGWECLADSLWEFGMMICTQLVRTTAR